MSTTTTQAIALRAVAAAAKRAAAANSDLERALNAARHEHGHSVRSIATAADLPVTTVQRHTSDSYGAGAKVLNHTTGRIERVES